MSKTVLVTGSAKGIGKVTILEFAKHGYNVVINYLNSKEAANNLKNAVENLYGVRALTIGADISNEEQVEQMIKEVIKQFGKIDVLVNNAAYCQDNAFLDKTKEEFMKVLEVNVVGTFLVTKYFLKYSLNGIVINISSLDATETYGTLSMDYCASKAAVNSLTQTFSLACPNIKFISLMLPWVNTEAIQEMFPEYLESELKRVKQKRLLEPSEVASKIYEIIDDKDIKSGTIIKYEF